MSSGAEADSNGHATPLYAVEDRRLSGEWRRVMECVSPLDAQLAAALLRSQGASDVRIVLIELGEHTLIARKTAQHRYIRIDDVIYTSEAFSTLPRSAMKLWIDLRTQLNGFNNGRIDATMSTLRKVHGRHQRRSIGRCAN